MAIYEVNGEGLVAIAETSFSVEGIYERKDIQNLLKINIEVLDEGLMVIAEEFGDWRLHRGGAASKVRITPQERSTATRAARLMGLSVAGVDILRSKNGPVVMEVNSSPGLAGIESTAGVDIAGRIIELLEKNTRPGRRQPRRRA